MKSGKSAANNNKNAATIRVELNTTLIYLDNISRETLKYLILTIPEVQRHII